SGRLATARSPYHPRFRQGATLVPRVLFMIEPVPAESADTRDRTTIRSARSAAEKAPWKALPAQHGALEREFIHRIHLGETVLPFRALEPRRAALPLDPGGHAILGRQAIEGYPGLTDWWEQ